MAGRDTLHYSAHFLCFCHGDAFVANMGNAIMVKGVKDTWQTRYRALRDCSPITDCIVNSLASS